MKINDVKFLFLVFSLFFVVHLYAQDTTQQKLYKTKDNVFIIYDGGKIISEKNDIISSKQGINSEHLFHVDPQKLSGKESIPSSFVKVLGWSAIDKMLKDRILTVNAVINRKGKIIRLDYVGGENTGMTMNDFDRLTTYIKKNVTYTVPADIGNKKYSSLIYLINSKKLNTLEKRNM
jgi:hypothetical protein